MNVFTARCTNCVNVVKRPSLKSTNIQCDECLERVRARNDIELGDKDMGRLEGWWPSSPEGSEAAKTFMGIDRGVFDPQLSQSYMGLTPFEQMQQYNQMAGQAVLGQQGGLDERNLGMQNFAIVRETQQQIAANLAEQRRQKVFRWVFTPGCLCPACNAHRGQKVSW